MAFIVVSYDIPSDRRRLKLRRKLKDYGEPVQYSVFEFNLKAKGKKSLVNAVKQNIRLIEDKVRIYELCEGCKKRAIVLGEGRITEDSLSLFV